MHDTWHKSSCSAGDENCVEVHESAVTVDVRDTQNRDCGHLSFPVDEWHCFLQDVSEHTF